MAVNHKRVLRIMRKESLLCHLKQRFVVRTTDSRHGLPVYPNVLTAAVLTAPDQAWVADLTYIRPARVPLCTWPVFWMRFRAAAWAGICRGT
jgi:putative transposase